MTPFDVPRKQAFENTLPIVFSTILENFLLFSSDLKLSSADCFKLDLSKNLSSGNGLKPFLF